MVFRLYSNSIQNRITLIKLDPQSQSLINVINYVIDLLMIARQITHLLFTSLISFKRLNIVIDDRLCFDIILI